MSADPHTPSQAEAGAGSSTRPSADFPYVLRWDRCGRLGSRCRIVARGRKTGSVMVKFTDGFEHILPRNAIVRAKECKFKGPKFGTKGGRGESPERAAFTGKPLSAAQSGDSNRQRGGE